MRHFFAGGGCIVCLFVESAWALAHALVDSLLTAFKTMARHWRDTMCGMSPVDVWQRGMVGLTRNPLEAFKGTTSSPLAAPRHAVD